MANPLLDEFGRRLMKEVRDETITDWRMILSAEMKGDRAEIIRQLTSDLDASTVNAIVPEVVDSVLHHLLRWLEGEDDFRISGKIGNSQSTDLANESDGLAGEMPSEKGWIARFSSEK